MAAVGAGAAGLNTGVQRPKLSRTMSTQLLAGTNAQVQDLSTQHALAHTVARVQHADIL